jgi:hypothetical protein
MHGRRRPLRRTVLFGLGALGASVVVPWVARVGAEDRPRATPIPTAPYVAGDDAAHPQRAVLYEEDAADPNGRQFTGTAVWSAVRESADAPSQSALDMVLRAKVAIPERGMVLQWSMQRDTEKLVWASHTIHLVFDLPPDYQHGSIRSVPGMLMKNAQNARGEPLIGTDVKVKSGHFIIGLSMVDAEIRRNVMLLKQRSWLDVPIVYTDGRRAILAIEKGPAGARAFDEAFAAWDGGMTGGDAK